MGYSIDVIYNHLECRLASFKACAFSNVIVVEVENIFWQWNGSGFQYAYRAGVVTDRKNFARVTRGWCKRHIQYARFKCQHRTARNITITQFEHFIQYCANLALNQFNFQFNRRARREFLLVDHVEHLA